MKILIRYCIYHCMCVCDVLSTKKIKRNREAMEINFWHFGPVGTDNDASFIRPIVLRTSRGHAYLSEKSAIAYSSGRGRWFTATLRESLWTRILLRHITIKPRDEESGITCSSLSFLPFFSLNQKDSSLPPPQAYNQSRGYTENFWNTGPRGIMNKITVNMQKNLHE